MSETWQKILQFQGEENRKIKIEQEQLNLKRLESERIELKKKELSEQKERERNERRAVELRKQNKATEIAISILEEIRKNSKEIRQARFSEIITEPPNVFSTVSLRWGNKFKITEEERQFLVKYCFLDFYHQDVGRRLPESFGGVDYSEIETRIDLDYALKIIAKPTVLMQKFAIQLAHPRRYLKTYVKGQDYWCPSLSHSERNPGGQ